MEVVRAQDFGKNFAGDSKVKIPWVRRDLCGPRLLVMEWVDGIRCTDPQGIKDAGIDVTEFIRCGVVSGLRQLLEVDLETSLNPKWTSQRHMGDWWPRATSIYICTLPSALV